MFNNYEIQVNQNLFLMIISIKIFFPCSIEWAFYSKGLNSLYLGNNTLIMCINHNDLKNIKHISSDTILTAGADLKLKQIYNNEFEEFSLAIKDTKATWIEDGKIVIFDLTQEKVEKVIKPMVENERYSEVHINPSGKFILGLVEIDREEESFFLYEWRVIDIESNDIIVLQKLQNSPDAFLSWFPDGEKILFYNEYEGTIPVITKSGQQATISILIPSMDMRIESVSFSPEGKYLALCFKDEEDQGEIFICLENGNDLRKLTDFKKLKMNPDNICWSPDGNWILFRDTYPPEPIMRFISLDSKEINSLVVVPVDYLDEPIAKWLSDEKNLFWFCQNSVTFIRLKDDFILRKK